MSYENVTKQIKLFSEDVQSYVNLAPKNLSKGQSNHINNSDGCQQLLTGLDATHHTNATIFNPKNEKTSTIT